MSLGARLGGRRVCVVIRRIPMGQVAARSPGEQWHDDENRKEGHDCLPARRHGTMHADWHVLAGKVEFITGVLRAHGARLTVEVHLRSQLHWASPVLATYSRIERPRLSSVLVTYSWLLRFAPPLSQQTHCGGVSLCSMLRHTDRVEQCRSPRCPPVFRASPFPSQQATGKSSPPHSCLRCLVLVLEPEVRVPCLLG